MRQVVGEEDIMMSRITQALAMKMVCYLEIYIKNTAAQAWRKSSRMGRCTRDAAAAQPAVAAVGVTAVGQGVTAAPKMTTSEMMMTCHLVLLLLPWLLQLLTEPGSAPRPGWQQQQQQ